ncbi:hypothetical protein [Nocardioides sp. TF02-7]|uniref:hypothetical protein n=1 Tax=Nocardioides sp. TF02-7 TaxID=2917724 RepID=UPI001F062E9E|nr:hypothetical protein [Nocardioides sp. TF02-7]UMG92871.1 hypothetical protein MF408_00300 [Nocardioides sp. TF02-7]
MTRDVATGDPVFATLRPRTGEVARSLLTPKDPGVPDGFYAMFVPGDGSVPVTVTASGYVPREGRVRVVPRAVVLRNWALTREAG